MQPRIVLIAFLIASLLFVQYGSSIEVIGSGSRAWARLYDRAFQAYSLERGGEATITYTRLINTAAGTAAQVARAALANNEVDFATADTIMTPQDLLSTPDMITFPTAATLIVPIFNLPGVASNKIILDMRTLALIFMGNITRWNAPELQALNPAIVLPATIIARVVRIDIIPLNTGIDQAFDTIPEWRDNVQTSSDSQFISYPDNGLPIYRCDGALPFSNAMSTVIGAIALSPLDDANRVGITYASMYNSAGRLVTPSVASTLFSVMEKGAQDMSDAIAQSQVTFNMNAAGLLAWPMTRYSYVVLRTNTYRATCRVRSETIRFWYWFYTSDVVVQIATALSFVIPPVEIRQQLGIESTLTSAMYCDDNLSYPVVRTGISLGSGSAIAADLFNVYPPIYNALSSTTGTITFQQTGSDRSLQRLVESEVDFASVMATVMAQDTLSAALDSNQVMLLPLFVRRVVPLYTLPTLLSTDNLKLSFEVLSLIWRGDITRWDDGRIAACNPDLQAAGKLPALNITLVFANAGDRDAEKLSMVAIAYRTRFLATPFNITYGTSGEVLPFTSSVWYSRVVKRSIIVADDRKIDSTVVANPGAIGFAMFDQSFSSRRGQLVLESGEVVADAPGAVYQCMIDAFDASTNRFRMHQSAHSGCWPLAGVAYTAVRPNNAAALCSNTARALKFLQYLHAQTSPTAEIAASLFATGSEADELTRAALAAFAANGLVTSTDVADQIGLVWQAPQFRAIVQKALQTITCEGETILVTLPVPHPLSDGIEAAALSMSVIGFVMVALLLCFLYFFHLRTAIKASSPLFLLATLSGVILLFVSGVSLSVTAPTDNTCRSAWWTVNLGFFLTFAPLFAKCWRIYKIFMRKEMTVIRITDSKLAFRLILALGLELLFLAIIEGVDPFRARQMVQSALPRDQIVYYCAPESASLAATLATTKGLMLLFGALMSFSTRSVSEHFNESRTIAFAIYNVLFTLAVVIPIALLQQSDFRTIWMLIVFVIYWITYATFLISFVPKIHAIYRDASGLLAARISDSQMSATDGSGSKTVGKTMKDFISQPVRLMDRQSLKQYMALLERELGVVRAALGTLDANEHVLAGGGGGKEHHYFSPPSAGDRNSHGDRDYPRTGGSLPMSSSSAGVTTMASDIGGGASKYGMASSIYRSGGGAGATSPANSATNTRRISPAPALPSASPPMKSSTSGGGSSSGAATRYTAPTTASSPKRSVGVTLTNPNTGIAQQPSFIANALGGSPPPIGARTAFTMESSLSNISSASSSSLAQTPSSSIAMTSMGGAARSGAVATGAPSSRVTSPPVTASALASAPAPMLTIGNNTSHGGGTHGLSMISTSPSAAAEDRSRAGTPQHVDTDRDTNSPQATDRLIEPHGHSSRMVKTSSHAIGQVSNLSSSHTSPAGNGDGGVAMAMAAANANANANTSSSS